MQKILLLILLFVFSLFHPGNEDKNHEININSASGSLDSLRSQVTRTGWNDSGLSAYQYHFLNSTGNISKEKDEIIKLSPSFERSFLYSLVLKRELKFQQMFDSLFSLLPSSPDYLFYYDELNFAAAAANKQSAIISYFEKDKSFKPGLRSYLMGLLNLSMSNSKSALVEMLNAVKSDSLSTRIWYQLSFIYRDLGNYPKALDALKKAYQNNINDKYLNSQIFLAQGSVFYLSGETDMAEKYYLNALQSAATLNDLHTKSRAMVNLGIIKDIKGNSKDARNYFNEARQIAAAINDLDNQALALSELGVSLTFTNNLINAKYNYLKSYEFYTILGNRGRLSYLSDNIAKIYMTMSDFNSALKFYNQGIKFAGDNVRAHILNLIGLADVFNNLSDYAKAIDYYNEARELAGQINELSLKAEVNKGLGVLNYNLDNFDNALHYFSSFEELNQKSGYIYLEADAFHKIGICLMQIDSLKRSGDYLLKAEANAQKAGDYYLEAICLTDLALLNVKMNNFSAASDFIRRAGTLTSKGKFYYLDARIELIAGDISGKFSDAKMHYESALTYADRINDPDMKIEAYNSLAKLFGKNNLSEAAQSYFVSAINLVDDISRPLFKSNDVQISYIASKQDIYSSYAEFLLKQKDYISAFNLIDKSRSRNLMQNLANLKLQSLIKDEKALNRLYEYNWMIHSGIFSKNQLDSIGIQFNIFKKDLIAGNGQLSAFLDNRSAITLSEIQDKLNVGENILSVYSTADNTFLLIINKKGLKTFPTGVSKNQVNKLLALISILWQGK